MADPTALTSAVEEYLEAIYRLSGGDEAPTTSRLAEHLKVRPASVTGMVKRLAELGLVSYKRYGSISLTAAGKRRARSLIRRHRLAERLLTDVIGVPIEQVHDEACRLEHALSPDVASRLAQALGDPDACPHGNPINANSQTRTIALLDAPIGRPVIIAQLEDESPEVIRYLTERKLTPRTQLTVTDREPGGGAIVVDIGGEPHTISRDLAMTIRVAKVRKRKKK